MTPKQKIAIENPCLLACETMHPRFASMHSGGSVILTVNTGYE